MTPCDAVSRSGRLARNSLERKDLRRVFARFGPCLTKSNPDTANVAAAGHCSVGIRDPHWHICAAGRPPARAGTPAGGGHGVGEGRWPRAGHDRTGWLPSIL
jgi:hypothetical protein